MGKSRFACLVIAISIAITGLTGCSGKEEKPDFSGYSQIAELSTIKCTYHNVAEIYNDGTDVLFGINIGYKKAWFEYDGIIELGIDASKVNIDDPDANGVVVITIPGAQVIGTPGVDVDSFSDIYSDTGLLTPITIVDQSEAYAKAQEDMRQSVESNRILMTNAHERAKTLLEQYVKNVGEQIGQTYTVKFVDVE